MSAFGWGFLTGAATVAVLVFVFSLLASAKRGDKIAAKIDEERKHYEEVRSKIVSEIRSDSDRALAERILRKLGRDAGSPGGSPPRGDGDA